MSTVPRIANGSRGRRPGRAGIRIVVAMMLGVLAWLGSVPAGSESSSGTASPDVLGRGRLVYQTSCAACHGPSGDGRGMAARMLSVPPRDFRQGLFKYRSTPSGSLPTDEDLFRIVTEGIRWTAMVGRPDLAEADRRAVVAYVKTFSPRFAEEPMPSPLVVPPAPPRSPDLLARGRQLYRDADCASCHGVEGHGDGASARGMHDDWGWPTWPSDLTWRPLKRGSLPEGTYLTIATGLSGTPMPAYGDSLDSGEIWALVSYLDSLVPMAQRVSPLRALGEEPRGWMIVHMHGMGGMMGPGMMRGMPGMPMPAR